MENRSNTKRLNILIRTNPASKSVKPYRQHNSFLEQHLLWAVNIHSFSCSRDSSKSNIHWYHHKSQPLGLNM